MTEVGNDKGSLSTLVFLTLAYSIAIVDRMIISVLFVPIKAEFGVSDAALGLLGGLAFALFFTTLGIPIARLADIGNRKTVIIFSLIVFSSITALSSLSSSFVMLFLLRLLVGVGEAGVTPATQSIIADSFPPARLSSAMAIVMTGASVGTIVGAVVGGIVSEQFGWRAAFLVAGLPGLFLAIAMILFFREPPRGAFVTTVVSERGPSIGETARALISQPASRYLAIGVTLQATLMYGLAQWLPSFTARNHGLDIAESGVILGLVVAPAGIPGTVLGGMLADRLALKGTYRIGGLMALTSVLAVPFLILSFQVYDLKLCLVFLAVSVFLASVYLGPGFALIQTLTHSKSRAVTAAFLTLTMNLFGLGLGPFAIGSLSDRFEVAWPEHGLSSALTVMSLIGLASGYCFWLCRSSLLAQQGQSDLGHPL